MKKKIALCLAVGSLINVGLAQADSTDCNKPGATTCSITAPTAKDSSFNSELKPFLNASLSDIQTTTSLDTSKPQQVSWAFDQGGKVVLARHCEPILTNKLGQPLITCQEPNFSVQLPIGIYKKGVKSLKLAINGDKEKMLGSTATKASGNSYTFDAMNGYIHKAALETYATHNGAATFKISGTYNDGKTFSISAPVALKEQTTGRMLVDLLNKTSQDDAINQYVDSDKAASNINAYYYSGLTLAILLTVAIGAGVLSAINKRKSKK
ncbi:hypothetical protein [Photobacterium leiognathi]|uniref:hypothetical protein n=1 Tax=Photobacterium leiognathi TaxID=553611 RepID=UPI002739B68A|nr:hypothetical protein [Photobacterium leiognathi]